MPAARWIATATDLTDNQDAWGDYLGLSAVCRETGLAPATVMDSTLRPIINDPATPRGALCRPAARIGQVGPTPLWTRAQVNDFWTRTDRRDQLRRENRRAELPVLTEEEAETQGLASIEDIAAVVPPPPRTPHAPIGRAVNTLRRYARDYRTTFPPELAIAPREEMHHCVPPLGYRSITAVLAWVADHEGNAWDDETGDGRGSDGLPASA